MHPVRNPAQAKGRRLLCLLFLWIDRLSPDSRAARLHLFVPREDVADRVTLKATQQSIEVVRVPESELLIFIGEAREAFAERFEEPSR